jgi:hypothetical protein
MKRALTDAVADVNGDSVEGIMYSRNGGTTN